MDDADLIARAREGSIRSPFYYGCQGCADTLLRDLADALARHANDKAAEKMADDIEPSILRLGHAKPLPADVAGLVERLNDYGRQTLSKTCQEAASLIASQAREIERLTQERDCFAEQAAARDNRDADMQEIMRINNEQKERADAAEARVRELEGVLQVHVAGLRLAKARVLELEKLTTCDGCGKPYG